MTWYTLDQKTPKIGYWIEERHLPSGNGGFTLVKEDSFVWARLGEDGVKWRYNVPTTDCVQPGKIEGLDAESALRSLIQRLDEVINHHFEPAIESMVGAEWTRVKEAYTYAKQITTEERVK